MSTNLEEDVRRALGEFADTARPVDLGPPALARAGRMRVRRAAGLAATAAAVVAFAAGVAIAVRPSPQQLPAIQPGPVIGATTDATVDHRVPLTDGWFFAAGPTAEGTRVWNTYTGEYDLYRKMSAWPAPQNTAVAFSSGTGLTVRTISTGAELVVVRDKAPFGAPQWNSLGTQLLVGVDLADGKGSVQYRLADLTRQTVTDLPALGCGKNCVLTWLPDFAHVAHLKPGDTMTVYDVHTGRQTGTLAFPVRSASAWSADGRTVVTQDALVEAATGRKICSLDSGNTDEVHWLDAGRFMVVNEVVHILDTKCKQVGSTTLPANWIVTEPAEYTMNHD